MLVKEFEMEISSSHEEFEFRLLFGGCHVGITLVHEFEREFVCRSQKFDVEDEFATEPSEPSCAIFVRE